MDASLSKGWIGVGWIRQIRRFARQVGVYLSLTCCRSGGPPKYGSDDEPFTPNSVPAVEGLAHNKIIVTVTGSFATSEVLNRPIPIAPRVSVASELAVGAPSLAETFCHRNVRA